MGTVGLRLGAGLVTVTLLLAGCGSNPEPKALPAPRPSASPSATPPEAPPVMPQAAKAKTRAGAEAFVKHYVEVVNYAGASGKTAPLQALSLPSCVKCQALTAGIGKVYSAGGRIIGGGWSVVGVRHYGFKTQHYFLDATIDSAPQQLIARSGATPQRFHGVHNRLRAFVLERTTGQWKVSELDPSA